MLRNSINLCYQTDFFPYIILLAFFAVVICVVHTPDIVQGFSLLLQGAIHIQETAQTFVLKLNNIFHLD